MYTTNLRKVGGSVMLAVPPAFLDQLHLEAGSQVGLAVDGDSLVISTKTRPRYSLAELLRESDYSHKRSDEERDWVSSSPVGRELI